RPQKLAQAKHTLASARRDLEHANFVWASGQLTRAVESSRAVPSAAVPPVDGRDDRLGPMPGRLRGETPDDPTAQAPHQRQESQAPSWQDLGHLVDAVM